MNKSIQLYPVLSFLTFYMIQISSKTYFAVFGIFLYIAAGVAFLAYLESSERNRKSDNIYTFYSIIFYTSKCWKHDRKNWAFIKQFKP